MIDLAASDRIVTLTAEVHVADSADPARVHTWENLGSIAALAYDPQARHKVMFAIVRGYKRAMRAGTVAFDPVYRVTSNQLSERIYGLIYHAVQTSEDNQQPAREGVEGKPIVIPAGKPMRPGTRCDLLTADGLPVFDVTAVTLTGTRADYGPNRDQLNPVEGFDFDLDGQLGQIAWRFPFDDEIFSVTLSAREITATSPQRMQAFRPYVAPTFERLCRIYWFDQDPLSNWVLGHLDFRARFSVEGGPQANAEADAAVDLLIHPLTSGRLVTRDRSPVRVPLTVLRFPVSDPPWFVFTEAEEPPPTWFITDDPADVFTLL